MQVVRSEGEDEERESCASWERRRTLVECG